MILIGKGGISYDLESAPFASGGEGEIYNILGKPNLVAKLYKQGKDTPTKEKKLIKMINFPPDSSVLSQISWPQDVLYSNNNFVGFVMPKLKINEELNVIYEYGPAAKYPKMLWENRITIAKNLCAVLSSVHAVGHTCGDLNPKNISVDPNTGHIVFVDTDSYHIEDGNDTYRCEVGIPEYLPAEVQSKMRAGSTLATVSLPTFTQDADNFALAVHIFQLLMNGVHPFACAIIPSQSSVVAPQPSDNILKGEFPFMQNIQGATIPPFAPQIDILPKEIQELFKRAFIDGHSNPSKRPTSYEWHSVLGNLESNLKNCHAVNHHQYYNTLSSCPWCAADAAFARRVHSAQPGLSQTTIKTPTVRTPVTNPTVGSNTHQNSSAPTTQPISNVHTNYSMPQIQKAKKAAFAVAIPALLLIFIFKIIPAFCALIVSMKRYSPMKGVLGSPFLGMQNYSMYFQSPLFGKTLWNTIALSTLSIILSSILAIVLILFIAKMPNKICKKISILILSIPAFIPLISYVGVFIRAFSPQTGIINELLVLLGNDRIYFFADSALYPMLYAIMDSLRNIFVPVILGVLICEKSVSIDFKKITIVMIGYILVRLTMILSPDMENILLSYSPMVYNKADVIDTYAYRVGLLNANYALSSTIWVMKTIFQLLINIGIYNIMTKFVFKLPDILNNLSDKVNRGLNSLMSILGYFIFAISSIAIIFLVFFSMQDGFFHAIKMLIENKEFLTSFINTLIYSILSCILFGFVTITLAYPLTGKSKLYPLFLIILMSLTNNIVGELIIFKSLGMSNTALSVILGSSLNVIGALALHFSIMDKLGNYTPSFSQYARISISPLITITALIFITNWGSYLYELIFINKNELYGISMYGMNMLFRQENMNFTNPVNTMMIETTKSAFIFLTSIIPVLIGSVLVFASKYLSAFSVRIRKS